MKRVCRLTLQAKLLTYASQKKKVQVLITFPSASAVRCL